MDSLLDDRDDDDIEVDQVHGIRNKAKECHPFGPFSEAFFQVRKKWQHQKHGNRLQTRTPNIIEGPDRFTHMELRVIQNVNPYQKQR